MTDIHLKELPTEKVIHEYATKYPHLSVDGILAMIRLMYVANQMERMLEANLSQYDMSLGRFKTLILLHRYSPEGLKPTELAEKISVTRGNMTGLLDGLEKSGLIYREDCQDDRRIVYIRLSEEGQKLIDKVLPTHFDQMSEAMKGIDHKDLEKLAVNLDKIREGLSVLMEQQQQNR
jgi:DNA-binding MarR family transcriptional regulator